MRRSRPLVQTALAAATLLTATVPVSPAAATPGRAPLIIGGRPASQPYPFMASQQSRTSQRHGCGAVLIAPGWAVGVVHCASPKVAHLLKLRLNSHDHQHGGEVVDIAEIIPAPSGRRRGRRDLTLIRLARPVKSRPVPIAALTPAAGTPVRLLGWGRECRADNCGPVTHLKELDTQVAENSQCYGRKPWWELCVAPGPREQHVCNGDSGSPALVRTKMGWELVGLTARSGAEPGQPLAAGARSIRRCGAHSVIYTDVTVFRDWILRRAGLVKGQAPEDPVPADAVDGPTGPNGLVDVPEDPDFPVDEALNPDQAVGPWAGKPVVG